MNQSYSDSDVSLSPSQILDRLQVLRQLQLLQRGKLQKQCLEYQETTETSSSITEIVSHFSNSTSYNTFRSLLHSSCDASNEVTPRLSASNNSNKVNERDLLEGVSALNLSQESEFIVNSPSSSKSRVSGQSRYEVVNSPVINNTELKLQTKKQISLDEMPILTPKKDFETLVMEKLKNEKSHASKEISKDQTGEGQCPGQKKMPFLKRGEGMARFGVKKTDLIIQNTKALPWKRKSLETRVSHTPNKNMKNNANSNVHFLLTKEPKLQLSKNKVIENKAINNINNNKTCIEHDKNISKEIEKTNSMELQSTNPPRPSPKIQLPQGKHPLRLNKGKTWAAVLTKEQDDFLRQLKQSEYYKNFTSPAKSSVSDASCNEQMYNIRQEREVAEQNMFELLENKVSNESFNMESSFLNKFLRRSMECSGESTPLVMQKCVANNPKLLHIYPDLQSKRNETHSECSCECTECSDTCSVSSCSTCKTVEETCTESPMEVNKKYSRKKDSTNKISKKEPGCQEKKELCHDDTVTADSEMKTNMAEMNAKLVATSELLKDRLRELEDEIETFRKENNNLAKLREEVDLERQKFYEEKNTFEQKFNEEKILSEYYLAEEKEKLTKQKQMYERYVREIRGRLNKKEKDEVISLKKDISDLKEEIRNKDAKSTSTIARLRNQLKIMEKEKTSLQGEVEKLKKENRRIIHSNDITRRLTNVKYLEEINKKLTNMTKNTQSEVDIDSDVKYKAHEIERQSRSRRVKTVSKGTVRPRAKSVPNFNVTSRYAKYFSQRDALSHCEGNESLHPESFNRYVSDEKTDNDDDIMLDDAESIEEHEELFEGDNNLERIYMERFRNASPVSNRSSLSNTDGSSFKANPDPYFIRKSVTNTSKSPKQLSPLYLNSNSYTNRSQSPASMLSQRCGGRSPSHSAEPNHESNTSKSPVSILSNRSSSSQKSATVIDQEQYRERLLNVSPEPSTSKTTLARTSMNPTEIKKPDGSKELRFPNGNIKHISADGKYSKFIYYNGDIKENFYSEGRIKYYYAEPKTYHTTHADGLEVLEFPDGQVEKRYKDGSSEIRLPNGSVRYHDPKNSQVREEWRFPDGTALTVSAAGDKRIVFSNGQVEVHAADHKRREFPDGTVKLVYTDGTSETRYASGRVRIKDKQGNLIMDSAPG